MCQLKLSDPICLKRKIKILWNCSFPQNCYTIFHFKQVLGILKVLRAVGQNGHKCLPVGGCSSFIALQTHSREISRQILVQGTAC